MTPERKENVAGNSPSETCLKELLLQRPLAGTEDGTTHDPCSVANVRDVI